MRNVDRQIDKLVLMNSSGVA